MAATPEHAARVLGLDLKATLEDVRRMRRAMAMKYHPDCSDNSERATRHMARINDATETLISYLKQQSSGKSQRRSPDYPDFAAQARTNRTGTQDRRSSASTATPPMAERRSRDDHCTGRRQSDVVVVSRPVEASGLSKADHALAQLAAKSYRSVLDRIGSRAAGPVVDQTALAFPAG